EPRDNAALRVTRDAMMAAPYLASGKGRLDVKLMETFPNRLVCKSGALGVFGIGLPDLGIGIALKIESGDGTAQKATALQALKQAMGDHMEDGVFEELWSELIPPITNLRGVVVGEVRWTQDMTRI
ncbi:MAG: asparaginase, partial [Candidatus Poribacteria bacterium]|nr:asparaginase [Candidatus Poribacteria bacterium]